MGVNELNYPEHSQKVFANYVVARASVLLFSYVPRENLGHDITLFWKSCKSRTMRLHPNDIDDSN